ncbi:MAG: bacteriocin [Firmicutes bacterium]|nr:bacteriocin [Bacillota bacterium]
MRELSKKELKQIIGGIDLTAGIINSFVRAFEIVLEIGRSFGTSIRRIGGSNICELE